MPGPQRPIDDVSKGRGRPGHDHKIASSAIEIIFNSLQFFPRQLLPEPNYAGPHEYATFRTPYKIDILVLFLMLLLVLSSAEFTARAARYKNVPMNLHHLLLCNSRTRVQVVHVLRDKQELVCVLGQFSNRRVRFIRLRVADALSPLAIPFPNQFRIARERFRRSQLCWIEVLPVTVLAAKCRDTALSRNARAGDYEDAHFQKCAL